MIVTFTIGEDVRALPVDDGAADNFTIEGCVVEAVVVVVVVCVLLLVLECTTDEPPLPIERLPAPLLSSLDFKLVLFLVLVLLVDLWERALTTGVAFTWFVRPPAADDSAAVVRFLPFLPSFDCDLREYFREVISDANKKDEKWQQQIFFFLVFPPKAHIAHTRLQDTHEMLAMFIDFDECAMDNEMSRYIVGEWREVNWWVVGWWLWWEE
jgi:hypothetical protein